MKKIILLCLGICLFGCTAKPEFEDVYKRQLLNSREESYRQVFEIIDSELREFQTKQTI